MLSVSGESKKIKVSWLTDDFAREIFGKEAHASEVDIKSAVNEGDNQVSDLYRLKYGHKSILVKAPVEDGIPEFTEEMDMFSKEKDVYSKFMPEVYKIVKTKITPDCYPVEDRLILEDMAAFGYATKNRRDMLDLEHSLGVIRTLGKLHAAGVVILSQDAPGLERVRNPAYASSPATDAIMTKLLVVMADVSKNWPEVKHLSSRLAKYVQKSYEYTAQEMLKPRRVSTILHGDCHTHNILFAKDKPDQPILIDFQFTQEGEPVMDLICFLYVSVQYDVLEEHLDTLLKAYVESYNSTLMDAKYSGPRTTLPEVKQRIDSYPHYQLHIAGTRMAVLLGKEGLQVIPALKNDTVEEVFDEESLGIKRMIEIILKSAEKGLF